MKNVKRLIERFTIVRERKITSSTKSTATKRKLLLVDVRAIPTNLVKY